jgi:hypothetical protein
MSKKKYQWAVIGAGPAGIAAVGKLLDKAIEPSTILWIDPYFKVGDLGQLWANVSSNTKVRLFTNFLQEVNAFDYKNAPIDFALNHLPPEETCPLRCMAEPLQWISDQLVPIVCAQKTHLRSIALSNRQWDLHTESRPLECGNVPLPNGRDSVGHYQAKNIILATGAVPTTLHYPDIDTIPFDIAIDKERLKTVINRNETYAVFGSSHSAIIIIRHLVELKVKKIINFYRSPCCYAVDMGDWTLFDNTGLKGQTAQWAREHIDGVWPSNLIRYHSNESNISNYLPECDKAIYAVGFNRRNTVAINGYDNNDYNPHVGIIGPGLFGFGIAFPEIKSDPFGCVETQVGLWKFMIYLEKVMPLWFKYST